MKRLLLEPDCTVLERSLLESVDLDVPSGATLERVRAAVAREEDTALVPAVAARKMALQRNWAPLIASIGGLAAGAGILVFSLARQHHQAPAEREPLPPVVHSLSPVPVAPTPPEPPPVIAVEPAIAPTPPLVVHPVASPLASAKVGIAAAIDAGVDCRTPYYYDAQGVKHYRKECVEQSAIGPNPPPRPIDPPSSGRAFDKAAAAAALGQVNLLPCKALDGGDGAGHVTVTFANDGSVSSAIVDSGSYPGTARGGCIAARFRAATVPPFVGPPVRVGKSFSLP